MSRIVLIFSSFLLAVVQAGAATLSVTVQDGDGKPLPDTVVYLQAMDPQAAAQAPEIRIEQKGKQFLPFVSSVQVGTIAYFPNRDGIGHHVYSFSPARPFELPLSEAENSASVQFDTPGIVTIGCNIHDWMVGYIHVVDTRWHGVTANDGRLVIGDFPAGNYRLHVWHPGLKSGDGPAEEITATATDSLTREYRLDIRPQYFWKPPQPPEHEEEQY